MPKAEWSRRLAKALNGRKRRQVENKKRMVANKRRVPEDK